MKILGLDYGTKRVGVAISDENAGFALPKTILENDDKILVKLAEIVESEEVDKIVIGDPGENALAIEVKNFAKGLEDRFLLPVIWKKEFMTSVHASQASGQKPIARQEKKTNGEKRDDSAAALILQRYLDRIKK